MSTITQRKKGWWKIWVLIALVFAVIAIGVALYYFGYDYISWIGTDLMAANTWAAASWINSALYGAVWLGIGVGITWIYYSYLAGQKVTGVQTTGTGYSPTPTYPSQPQNTGKDTVIS